jgi:hypothetical protein
MSHRVTRYLFPSEMRTPRTELLFLILTVTGRFFGFLPGFRGVLHGFFVSFRLCYEFFFLGIQTVRGPQELRQRALYCDNTLYLL